MSLRKLAAHRVCQVRMPGICTGGPCVLAHVRLAGLSGMGIKIPDALGAWACDACHRAYDTHDRTKHQRDTVDKWFLEGVMRTQYALIREGRLGELDSR
jgi:hypothetical protein